MKQSVWLSVLLAAPFAGAAPAAVTTESLLDDMTDLQRLTRLPDPPYTTRQFSSYDRLSKDPSDAEGWFANADFSQFLRVEEKAGRQEFVMADVDGPGAIVRIWSADPRGTLRVYLDGSEKPVVEALMEDVLGGKFPGLPIPIAGVRSRGWNLYFPIPYAKHCKVTSDNGHFYYHVNCRTYAKGVEVETFAADALKRLAAKIEGVASRLASPRKAAAMPDDVKEVPIRTTLAPGSKIDVNLAGPLAICRFEMTIGAADVARAARGVVLQMSFDGEPAVESPLGDFFGAAPGANKFEALPLGVTADKPPRFWCHWQMPCAKTAFLRLVNLGDQIAEINATLAWSPYTWDDRSLLFHAKWRTERDIPTRPFVDWTHLDCRGSGRFVGGALHFINPVRGWWGEGDEKIYVDGEKFPSTFGTGTEDYYGYAWGWPDLFTHAYHSQSRCDGPKVYGNTSLNRFHILDDIPFTKQFRFDMENWHHREGFKVSRAAISYWYARPGGTDAFKPITRDDVKLIDVAPYVAKHVSGAIEGEQLAILEKTGEAAPVTFDDRVSGDEILRWVATKPGDRLVLGFDADAAGKRHVVVRLHRAGDYAQVQLYVNGQKAGDVIDLYSQKGAPADEIDLGEFDLVKGRNRLAVEIVGINDAAKKNYTFGIDYLRLP